jgi:hypothetical protein
LELLVPPEESDESALKFKDLWMMDGQDLLRFVKHDLEHSYGQLVIAVVSAKNAANLCEYVVGTQF